MFCSKPLIRTLAQRHSSHDVPVCPPSSPPAVSECSGQGTYCGGASNRALPKGLWKRGVHGLPTSAPVVIYAHFCPLFSQWGLAASWSWGVFPPWGQRFVSLSDGASAAHCSSPTAALVPFSDQRSHNRVGDPRRQGAPLPAIPFPNACGCVTS